METIGRYVKLSKCSCGDIFPHDFGGRQMTVEESNQLLQQLLEQSWGASMDNTQGLVWGTLFPPTHRPLRFKECRRTKRSRSCTKK